MAARDALLALGVLVTEMLEEEELAAFLGKHGDQIYSYLCILCRDEEKAAEALQNAYLKFLKMVRRGKVRRESAVAYLQTIARNDYFSSLRQDRRNMPLLDEPPDSDAQDRAASAALARELRLVMYETMSAAATPQDVARVMQLRFIDNLSVEEICSQLEKSPATIYRLMEKSLTLLAEACRKAGIQPGGLS
ncbi:MAG: sigma-70 family RNA polymerase sigma factor [Leptospirales bacterium]|nr:sigma-70 family RNA polymerase sigma factor [Leptospirales bacterium]